jgi:hypothetical protein
MDPTADSDTPKKRDICCLHRKTNPDSSIIQPGAQSLDRDILAATENEFFS